MVVGMQQLVSLPSTRCNCDRYPETDWCVRFLSRASGYDRRVDFALG